MEKIKQILDEFVAGGGDVNKLTSNHPVYIKVKKHKVFDKNGNPLSVGQKFQQAGHPRMPHGYLSCEYQLYVKATEYLSKGGSLHIPRHKLPFYPQIKGLLKKHQRQTGTTTTPKAVLESVGIFGYSDIYYSYLPLFEISTFKDKNGNVDSYRKNAAFKGEVVYQSKLLDLPESLFVQLVLDENLEKSVLQTDRVAFCRQQMKEHVQKHNSFVGIRRDNPELYELMRSVKDNICTSNGVPISMADFIKIMDFENVEHKFLTKFTGQIPNIDNIFENIKKSNPNTKQFKCSSLSREDYDDLCEYAIRKNISLAKLFAEHGLEYTDQGNKEIFNFVYTQSYPFIDEMRELRDELMNEFKNQNPTMVKEDLFENYLLICKSVYEQYKDKIHSYGIDTKFDSSKIRSGEFVFDMPEL